MTFLTNVSILIHAKIKSSPTVRQTKSEQEKISNDYSSSSTDSNSESKSFWMVSYSSQTNTYSIRQICF